MANEQPKLSFKLGVESGLPSSGNIKAGTLYLSKQEETYDKRAKLYYGDNSTTLLPISDIQALSEGNQGLCLKGVTSVRGGLLFGEVGYPFNHAIELGTAGKNELNFYEYSGIFNFYQHPQNSQTKPELSLCGSIKPDGFHGNVTGNVTGTADSANALTYTADNSQVGSATRPVYFSNGVPVATEYSLQKSVPSDAVFTDTTYSAGTGLSLSSGMFSLNAANAITLGGVRMSYGTEAPPTTTNIGQIYFQIVN